MKTFSVPQHEKQLWVRLMIGRNGEKNFHWFSGIKKIKRYGKYSSRGAVWGERFERTIRSFTKFVFEKSDANWVDEMISLAKKYNHTKHSLTKLTPSVFNEQWG